MHRLVGDVDLPLELSEAHLESEKRVDREQRPPKHDLRMSEDRAGFVIERAVAILTEIPLERPVTVASDRHSEAVKTNNTVTPADLLQQGRCDRFRPKHIERSFVTDTADAVPLSSVTHSDR